MSGNKCVQNIIPTGDWSIYTIRLDSTLVVVDTSNYNVNLILPIPCKSENNTINIELKHPFGLNANIFTDTGGTVIFICS